MKLYKPYQWLADEPAPRHLLEALKLYGVTEIVGSRHNPIIMAWALELGLQKVYKADEIPWCGLFMAIVMKRAGRVPIDGPLWALNWNRFGVKVTEPMLADVLTFSRKGGGHVGQYIAEDTLTYHVLGGNQGNRVSILRIEKSRLAGARRPAYINQPENIRKIIMDGSGVISTNEA